MSDFFDFTERYLSTDGKEYIDANSVREVLGVVDEHVDILGVIKKLREERDQLKEKCDKMKKRANAVYGTSCGYSEYSGDKAPAFRCNVISYSWNFGLIAAHTLMDEPSYPISSDSIRVELDLTPTANYKGTFDLEDLKKYIQAYGREKKLSDFEIFCKLVDNCIDELCDKYNVNQPVRSQTTRERLDYIFAVLADYRELANNNFNKVEGFRKEKRAVEDSLAELRAKIREIYLEMYLTGNDEPDSYIERLHLIHEEYKRVVHNFEERTADWSKAQKEYSRYRLAVNSLLDIPKDIRDDINAIERAFTFSKREYKSLKEFRDNVCEILDIPSNMADNYVLKEIHDVADRYDELEDFRADICGALDIEGMLGTPQQNDQYILAQVEKLKDIRVVVTHGCDHNDTSLDRYARFRSNICTALCLGGETRDEDILNAITKMREEGNKLARLRSNICSEFSLVPENCDGNIIGHVHMMQDCHDKLREFRDAVAKAIGMEYPTTNQVILNNVQYIYKDRKDAYDIVAKLHDHVTELEKAKEDLKQKFEFQSGLRQQWHARYESEHERANGVQKALDREREKCRVKDISLETAKKQYEKVCSNLETAECALTGMKSKVRSLQEEKTKVISALGQDIWDDCLK